MARMKQTVPNHILLQIYNSIIQPAFDYAITIWGSTSDFNIAEIRRIQNHAARIISGNFDYNNHRGLAIVHSLGWVDIKQRCTYFQILLMFKCIHGRASDYLVGDVLMEIEVKTVNIRSHNMNVCVTFPEKERSKQRFMYRGAKKWNQLPGDITDITNINTFKCLLRKFKVQKQRDLWCYSDWWCQIYYVFI